MKKVLIVDDSPEYIQDAKASLENKSYHIDVASDYAHAQKLADKAKYDCVIVNVEIEMSDGFCLASSLLNGQNKVPLIVLASKVSNDVFKRAIETGAADVIEKKEVTPALLDRSIHYAIERSRYMHDLKHKEDLFRCFMDNSPVVAFMKDEDGCYVYVNKALTEQFEIPEDKWVGKNAIDIFGQEVGAPLSATDAIVRESMKKIEVMESAPTKNCPEARWFVCKFPFHDPNGRVFLAGLALQDFEGQLNDFKEVISTEMETQTFNAINSFISGIVHEVRSPLQAIDSAAELLADDDSGELTMTDDERKRSLKTIRTSVNLIDGIVTNCMTFGNFKTEKSGSIHKTVMLDMKQVNLHSLITETVDVFEKTIEFKDNPIKIELNCPRNIRCVIPNHVVRKILLNLLSNGLKAIATYRDKDYTIKKGKIQIRVTESGDDISIEVEDNGRGINEDVSAKLFNPFYRAYRDVPGMGLGLYLCKVWASNANMEIYLKSSQPSKTIFKIDFCHIEQKENNNA